MKKVLIVCLFGFVLAACATVDEPRVARYPNVVTPAAEAEFSVANKLYRDGRFPEADSAFAAIIANYPYNELTDRSLFYRGEIAFDRGDYSGAIGLYKKSYARVDSPSITPRAKFKVALSLYKLGRCGEAITELETIDRTNTSAILRLRVDSLAINGSDRVGAVLATKIVWYLFILDDYADGAGQRTAEVASEKLIAEDDALVKSDAGWMTPLFRLQA